MCKCADEIARAADGALRIPDLVNIVVEYMHTFIGRGNYKSLNKWMFVGYADGSTEDDSKMDGDNRRLCSTDAVILWLGCEFPYDIHISVTHMRSGVMLFGNIVLETPSWDSVIDHLDRDNRDNLWQGTRLDGSCPVEFNAACDCMLERVQNYLNDEQRNLVCQWDNESLVDDWVGICDAIVPPR